MGLGDLWDDIIWKAREIAWDAEDMARNAKYKITDAADTVKWGVEDAVDTVKDAFKKTEPTSEKTYTILEDQSSEVKHAYIMTVAAFANVDGVINAMELNRLYALCARIKIDEKTRRDILSKVSELASVDEYLSILSNRSDADSKALFTSLLKDIIIISGTKYKNYTQEQKVFCDRILSLAKLNEKVFDIIQDSIDAETAYINGNISEAKFQETMGKIAGSAAGVGVPIAALYLSGSVVGLSAAGITSGLAALGLGGVLGLSAMVTGVGAVVLLGVTIYKGITSAANRSSKAQQKRREVLLKASVEVNERTIAALTSDVSYISNELNRALKEIETNSERIKRLGATLDLLTGAAKQSTAEKDAKAQMIVICGED